MTKKVVLMFERKQHWDRIYQDNKFSDVSWYQDKPTISLDLIRATQVKSDDPIIDVGGGTSFLVDYLLKHGYSKLTVLDISEKALAISKKRLGNSLHSIEWLQGDITQFKASHKFSIWHDRAVFHFLTAKTDRQKYIQSLKHALISRGHVIIAAFAIGGPAKCSGLDVVQYDANKLVAELGESFKLLEQKVETHITPTGKEQEFTYFRFSRQTA